MKKIAIANRKGGVEIRQEYHDTLKAIAYWDRRRLRDVIDEALKAYIEGKGDIEPMPE